ncbi:hypothetical protein [Mesorhizobium sp.]|uniref:hypothetical protein n=1 Tax=Mesorhizobium sp. TaxID=1871066 RepID=UPI0025C225F7|nr:hypothetical protein [Mesorhizobium sp.]
MRNVDREPHSQREDRYGSSEQNREIAFAIPGKAVHPTNDISELPHPFRLHFCGAAPLGKAVQDFGQKPPKDAQQAVNALFLLPFGKVEGEREVNENALAKSAS